MRNEDRIPLREAARRLAGYEAFRRTRTRGKQELFKLLQKGELAATFDFPSAARPTIQIPADFWLDIPSGEFQRQLTSSVRRGRHGQFLVRAGKFIDQYVEWFKSQYFDQSEKPPTDVSAELASALAGAKRERETYILESEWARFVREAGLDQVEHHDEVLKSPKGKRAFEAWEGVLVEVAAEMLARQSQSLRLEEQQTEIAANAVSRAQRNAKQGAQLPLVETVAKKIRVILDKASELSDRDRHDQ
jgi:hypothetical protein